MDALECIATRRSIRKFQDIPLEFEKLGNILDAARFAPSAGNLQDVKIILVTDEQARQDIGSACVEQYWVGTAQVILVVCTDPDKTKRFYGEKGVLYSAHNAGTAVQNILLAAHDQGVSSCWVGAFEEEKLRRIVGVPGNAAIHAVIPLGYADEKVPMPVRLTLENVVFLGSWGNRIKDIAAYMEWYGEHVQKAIKKGKQLVSDFARRLQG
ncbi:nitroreductase family protein [Candidatus Woesearchaeota archaeon]|nr:nitroreductase family protein [Candidatus Woesearchaeota archaeon]